jgi:UDP-glucuronate decarboxylase
VAGQPYCELATVGCDPSFGSWTPSTGLANLKNPIALSIKELDEKILALTGSRSTLSFKPLPDGDPVQHRPDIGMAHELLSWEPMIRLEDGLVETLGHFDEHLTGLGLIGA